MRFSAIAQFARRQSADVLVIPFWEGKNLPELACEKAKLALPEIALPLNSGDFKGREGSLLVLYISSLPEQRVMLLGLGRKDKISSEVLRRCYGSCVNQCREKSWRSLNVLLPIVSKSRNILLRGICEGLLLANYRFVELKRTETPSSRLVEQVQLIGAQAADLKIAEECAVVARAVYEVRDLVNGNADDVTPSRLVKEAKQLAARYPEMSLTLFDKARIEREGLGLLYAVGRASPHDPAFFTLQYTGNPRSKDHTVIVGKGITFDTGGLNLKLLDMEEMKNDMAGAAAVLGTLSAVAALGYKVNVTGVVAAAENAIDGLSFKPGGVYVGYAGKSVEIGSTDAEGRLALADGLAYAVKHLKPSRMIDIATLTGSIIIALGNDVTGLMSNDEELAQSLIAAGDETYERVWRMPLVEEYRVRLKSEVADIKSTGGRPGSAILAALFLREFVGDIPWAHLDIGGTAYLKESHGYLPGHATGVGVRLLTTFLKSLS